MQRFSYPRIFVVEVINNNENLDLPIFFHLQRFISGNAQRAPRSIIFWYLFFESMRIVWIVVAGVIIERVSDGGCVRFLAITGLFFDFSFYLR